MTYYLLYNKEWKCWRYMRAHFCTFAINFTYANLWKVPREGFRHGGLSYGLLVSFALIFVGLPVAFLQLSLGQLSQQDPVGIWRAVPFFRGLGYLRLMISYLASLFTVFYISLSAAYFLSTIGNGIPFPECKYFLPSGYETALNASECLEETYMAAVTQKPEYYIALALMIAVLWIIFPFLLFNPNKFMKRTFYLLGPIVLLLMIIIFAYIGDIINLSIGSFQSVSWDQLLQPYIWHAAVTQALLSTHTAGGFMTCVGDTVYQNMNVRRVAVAIVTTNIVSIWISLLFWFSLSPEFVKYDSPVAVLIQTYETAQTNGMGHVWPELTFVMLVCCGIITMVTLLTPLYSRFRQRGGVRWRLLSFSASLLGVLLTLLLVLVGLPALRILEDIAVPFLISVTTMAEVAVFICIYGLDMVVEDIQFLTNDSLHQCWVYGFRSVTLIMLPLWAWWTWVVGTAGGAAAEDTVPPAALALVVVAALSGVVLLLAAAVAVFTQYQYDFVAKLLSSFRPSRHWGPRDPITNHYWRARLRLSPSAAPAPSASAASADKSTEIGETKYRSNSDDWVYMIYRKAYIKENIMDFVKKTRRTKSLDPSFIPTDTPRMPHPENIVVSSKHQKTETKNDSKKEDS